MLKTEVVDYTSKSTYTISYFEDDTIETMRNRIAAVMNTHPNRLYIMVSLQFKNNYYEKDPRRWENLFDRLSYNGKVILKEPFYEFQTNYRSPQTNIVYGTYDRSEWMHKPQPLEDIHSSTRDFSELRIFGVEERLSYVLPLNFNGPLVTKIPSSQLPLPQLPTLLSTIYNPASIEKFVVIPYESQYENVSYIYYPYLTASTPTRLSEEIINLINKNTKLLDDLLNFKDVFPEESINVTRSRIYTKLVETDFGDAVRTRFEQIFFGQTLSKEVPYIGLFTGRTEVMRHKFFVENPSENKKPFLDVNMLKKWLRKPSRSIPTLILYRGTDRFNYDRVAISDEDVVITFFRDRSSTEKIETMQREALTWLRSCDAIMSFVNKNDIDNERWELQEIEMYLNYKRRIEYIDTRRLNCISFLFNHTNANDTEFNFLRSENISTGIDPVDVKVIQMLSEGEVQPSTLAQDLGISLEKAKILIKDIQAKLDEDPSLEKRAFRKQPTLLIEEKSTKISFVTEIDRIVKYANILRFLLGHDSPNVDKICPKRIEKVNIGTATVPVQREEVSEESKSMFGDLFGFLEQEQEVKEEKPVEVKSTKIPIVQKNETMYSYFKERLEDFDQETFNPNVKGFRYAKECEQNRQPVILDEKQLKRLKNTDYDPQNYEDKKKVLSIYDPDGAVVCPEYWCMNDQIPLNDDQLLEDENGELLCPVCYRKVRKSDNDNPREYSVIKRKDGLNYPGFVNYKSPLNDKNMPCCFKKPQKIKTDDADQKYYIVGETKLILKDFRLAFLPPQLNSSLQLNETYEMIKSSNSNRLQNGMSAFFRVGIGRPSQNIPEFLGLKTVIPRPKESIETILKCSFIRTWKLTDNDNVENISKSLMKIPPYNNDEIARSTLAGIIGGIDTAFANNKLSMLQELEYVCLFLNCDVFRIQLDTNTLGCLFYSPMTRPRSRGIVLLQNKGYVDILSYVTRFPRGFEYKSNVFEAPFKKETYTVLEKLRTESCQTKLPNFNTALNIIQDILLESKQPDFQVVLDPFGRAQSFFILNHAIIPFQSVPSPSMKQAKLNSYNSIAPETLPKYDKIKPYLEKAVKYHEGYGVVEDLYNNDGQRVEILLKSGLRIPVYPEKIQQNETLEVIESMNTIGESNLVFGKPSQELEKEYKSISYASEVYEFLIFELTNDISSGDYNALRKTLLEPNPNVKQVEAQLRKWFDAKVDFVKLKTPIDFISKIRKPCGQFKSKDTCSGNLCSWNGKTCNISIRDTIKKEPLFSKLLNTLINNLKIRAMILDGRTTPFFSTALYLEFPNELILSDLDIVNVDVR